MINAADKGNKREALKKKKEVKDQFSPEQTNLNTEVFNFIGALIGCRIKENKRSHLKDVYKTCY